VGGPEDANVLKIEHASAVPPGTIQRNEGIVNQDGVTLNKSSHRPFKIVAATGVIKKRPVKKKSKLKLDCKRPSNKIDPPKMTGRLRNP
jgi:hypothetical protein